MTNDDAVGGTYLVLDCTSDPDAGTLLRLRAARFDAALAAAVCHGFASGDEAAAVPKMPRPPMAGWRDIVYADPATGHQDALLAISSRLYGDALFVEIRDAEALTAALARDAVIDATARSRGEAMTNDDKPKLAPSPAQILVARAQATHKLLGAIAADEPARVEVIREALEKTADAEREACAQLAERGGSVDGVVLAGLIRARGLGV